jgi:hypothetical protein
MSQPCDHELPDDRQCSCNCGEPIAFTIQFGDDPPTFHVNIDRLEKISQIVASTSNDLRRQMD